MFCKECFEKQRKIDKLEEENKLLKSKLRYRERSNEGGFFGSSTPSSQLPVKSNSLEENQKKCGGAKKGHLGHGRRGLEIDPSARVIEVEPEVGELCPECGSHLMNTGMEQRSVVEISSIKPEKRLYLLKKRYCPKCHRTFRPRPKGILPKSLYGNQLITTAVSMHYLHGIPMGRVCEQMGIEISSLLNIFHRLTRIFEGIIPQIIEEYRQSPVKHADETSWRNDGQSGYVWLFATKEISIFLYRKSRCAKVVKEVFEDKELPGALVVDRYASYNKVPCKIQYCYAHLKRDIEDIEKEFPDDTEVKGFVETAVPLLSMAMSLRSQPISDEIFYDRAKELKGQILEVMNKPANHMAIRNIQDIFYEKADRLYLWTEDRNIPAENNLAERDLRPTVIARKVSFGSQSDHGAHTREVLTTIFHTLKKQTKDPALIFKSALDQFAFNSKTDLYELLFSNKTSSDTS